MPKLTLALLALALLGVVGCASRPEVFVPNKVAVTVPKDLRRVLEAPFRLELLTLDPDPIGFAEEGGSADSDAADAPQQKVFHGYRVLGQAFADVTETEALIGALYAGIDENDGSVAACFNPRHGIRAELDGMVVELVICFECNSMSVYSNGQEGKGILTTSSPEPEFNRVATLLNLPLATK